MKPWFGERDLENSSTGWLWFCFVLVQFGSVWFVPLLTVSVVVGRLMRDPPGRLLPAFPWPVLAFWALGMVLSLRIATVLRYREAATWRRIGTVAGVTAFVALVAVAVYSWPTSSWQ